MHTLYGVNFMNRFSGTVLNNELVSLHASEYLFDKKYRILFYGQITNRDKVINELLTHRKIQESISDEELVLLSYLEFRYTCMEHLEGPFVFVIQDGDKVIMVRDQLGIKPLFYKQTNNGLLFSASLDDLLHDSTVEVDKEGLLELIGLGPSFTQGKSIYQGIKLLCGGNYLLVTDNEISIVEYWRLHAKPHTDDLETTMNKVRELVEKSILSMCRDDKPVATMLSGGLDSSIIASVLGSNNIPFKSFSLDYVENDINFKPYDYQQTRDIDFINDCVNKYPSDHKLIVATQESLVNNLETSMIGRGMPGMADIDSSLLVFLQEISKDVDTVFSGECADEALGGYPWFYKEELYSIDGFPWIRSLDKRTQLLSDKITNLNLEDYIYQAYLDTLDMVEYLDNDTEEDKRKRRTIILNLYGFMQTLILRGESQCSLSGVNVQMPFASYKLFEYTYNIPYEMMFLNGQEKGLLREAFKDILPDSIYQRKKSPFPKTYSPIYTRLVCDAMIESLKDNDNILFKLFKKSEIVKLIITNGASFNVPWFGQLMMGPQLLAYLLQIYQWGKHYSIEIKD